MRIVIKYGSFFVAALLLFSSCKTSKEVGGKKNLNHKSTSFLINQINQAEFNEKWVSFKTAVAFKSDKLSDSFKMNIRMRKDSVIWVSATYYAVEVARFYFTPDSLKFMDRKNNEFFVGDFSFLSKKFNLNMDFFSLQAVILGGAVGIEDSTHLVSFIDEKNYVLSSFSKKNLRRALDHREGNDEKIDAAELDNKTLYFTNWIKPENFKVSKSLIFNPESAQSLVTEYKTHEETEGKLFPKDLAMDVRSNQKQVKITVEYYKPSFEKGVKFPFTIPEKYAPITL